jgi:putative transposase
MVSTELRRAAVSFLKERGLSERRSCVLAGVSRSGLRYQAHPRDNSDLAERLREIARRHKRYGYRRAHALLRRDEFKVNHKRVHRLWKQIGLQCPVRRKRKRSQHPGSVPQEATHPNHVWTYDFVFDTTSDSRTLKFLTLVDEFTRECLAIKVERRLPAKAVIEVLEQVFTERGMPEFLRSDNGPEFIAKAIQGWLQERQVKTRYIEPGSPWQNAYGESFNGKFRDECLNMEVFYSRAEATTIVESWRWSYNHERPHSSLAYQTPAEFAAAWHLASLLEADRMREQTAKLYAEAEQERTNRQGAKDGQASE